MGGAIVSEPRESFSRVFLRSNSHFKQRQGISSPSRVIFTCFSTFQQPFQATSRGFSSPSRVNFTCFSTLQFSSPSRVIFTCFSTFQEPLQATARNFITFESHLHVLFDVPTAISSNGKEFLHLRESSSRVFLRSNSHFNPLQGFSSPSRVIFMCFSTSQQPFQSTSRIFFSHLQCTICPQVPPKGSPVPPKCPLVPRFYPKRLSNILNRETMHHMPPSPP